MPEAIHAPGLMEPIGPYADAVRTGDLLFLSGCVPVDAEGRTVGAPGDVRAQARQVFSNIGEVLAAAGASFQDIVKLTVYVTDVADRAHLNDIRRELFGDWKPASTLVEVSALAVDAWKVEVEAIVELRGA